ncbi:LAMI_0C02586g1_1 [Lachancea mirantina]|uniref:LAMI_0C02586g1_1 n=1 Tax=Lachancea mirantina TaxID=1230905 RepID=A0A1G4J1B4_9SACH|nr:LAMI_0C02586g1_1 [Lachancea mirantina]
MVNTLSSKLKDLEPVLSAFEKRQAYSKVDRASKLVRSKLEQNNRSIRTFQFKKKPLVKTFSEKTAFKSINLDVNHDAVQTLVGKDLTVECGVQSFVNLTKCRISYNAQDSTIQRTNTGALSFDTFTGCCVDLNGLPFLKGSIAARNCNYTLFKIVLTAETQVQIRFYNLSNCQLYVTKKGSHRQDIILEKCEKCTIHSSTKDYLDIYDFERLGSRSTNPGGGMGMAFEFDEFEI